MWQFEAMVAGLVEPVDTTLPITSLLSTYGFVVPPGEGDEMLRSLPWVFPQAGASPGATALLPAPDGHVLLYDERDGFRYASRPGVTLDELLRFAREHGR